MSVWSVLDTILDWFCHWRFNVCFWGSLIFAAVVASGIGYEPLRSVVAGAILVAGVVIGFRWDHQR